MIDDLDAIERYMTHSPYVVQAKSSLASASRLMREIRARQLPVLEEGELVGMLSERDVLLLEARTDLDCDSTPVSSAMQVDVCAVSHETSLEEVVRTMTKHKFGSAVVWNGPSVVGVFTAVEAVRALGELIRRELER
jgi:acetoin utilization protein AcuB